MKFHWFHLMAYPYLPDDFKQRYPSVWVTPPAALRGHSYRVRNSGREVTRPSPPV